MATPFSFSCWTEEQVTKTVRLMKVLRGLKLGSLLTSVSGLSLTEEELKCATQLWNESVKNCGIGYLLVLQLVTI